MLFTEGEAVVLSPDQLIKSSTGVFLDLSVAASKSSSKADAAIVFVLVIVIGGESIVSAGGLAISTG